jgi:hypothetical protein
VQKTPKKKNIFFVDRFYALALVARLPLSLSLDVFSISKHERKNKQSIQLMIKQNSTIQSALEAFASWKANTLYTVFFPESETH